MSDEPVSKKAKLDKRLSGRRTDRIVLNVGGTKISACKVTLSSSSLYFSRQFANEWNDNCSEDDEEEFFLDQDPNDFQILLSFMRLGKIEAKKLTACVLMQANFLAMERLLEAVRVIAKRMAFNGDKVLLEAALKAGIINTNEAFIKKEFASLVIFCPSKMRGGTALTPLTFAEIRGLKENTPNKKTTFIDGLNLLSRLGYNKFEEDASKTDIETSNVIANLHFSRLLENEGPNELENLVLVDDPSYDRRGEKEFALHIKFRDGTGFRHSIMAANGGRKSLNIRFPGDFIDEDCTVITKVTSLYHSSGYESMTWLNHERYEIRESRLESSYVSALPMMKSIISSMSLWSRWVQTGST